MCYQSAPLYYPSNIFKLHYSACMKYALQAEQRVEATPKK